MSQLPAVQAPEDLRRALGTLDPDFPHPAGYALACSGGADSVALLHLLARLQWRTPRLRLRVLHVDHRLHADSPATATAVQALAATFGLACDVRVLAQRPAPGESVEAWARRHRYAALAAALGPAERLLSAHHAQDQAETVLLQALRGGGPAGLAGIAARRALAAGEAPRLLRPLLATPRPWLRDYVRVRQLPIREDPTNLETRFARNHLRTQLWPGLASRWPGAERALGRVARLQAEQRQLAAELAAIDLDASLHAGRPDRLPLAPLQALSAVRQRNLLRHWLAHAGLPPPDAARLDQLQTVLLRQPAGRVDWAGGQVRRYRDHLYALGADDPAVMAGGRGATRWPTLWPHPAGAPLELGALGRLRLPADAALPAAAGAGPLLVDLRRGGERWAQEGYSRPVKSLLQEAGIVPWRRALMPFIWLPATADRPRRLLAVAGLALRASPGNPALRVLWEGAPPLD